MVKHLLHHLINRQQIYSHILRPHFFEDSNKIYFIANHNCKWKNRFLGFHCCENIEYYQQNQFAVHICNKNDNGWAEISDYAFASPTYFKYEKLQYKNDWGMIKSLPLDSHFKITKVTFQKNTITPASKEIQKKTLL